MTGTVYSPDIFNALGSPAAFYRHFCLSDTVTSLHHLITLGPGLSKTKPMSRLLTHLFSQPLVQHWGSACHFWQRHSCTACTVHSCPLECVWHRTPGLPGGVESMVVGWRSRPGAPEVEVSGPLGYGLMAKHGFVFCSFQVCKKY